MSLTVQLTQYGINNHTNGSNNTAGVEQNGEKGKAVFAGTLLVPSQTDSLVEQKRESARKDAMKLVTDAWGKDQAAFQKIDEKRALREDKLTQIKDSKVRVEDIEEAKARLQQQYDVDPESQEQKDLELLEKYQDRVSGVHNITFTDEERSRLKELQFMPRTEYQTEVLKLNKDSAEERVNIERLQWQTERLKGSIEYDKLKQSISQGMLKAEDAAEELMEAASADIKNLLIQESKDQLDDDVEEQQEKAEELKEQKEEQQERIEESKENREEQKELIEGDLESDKLERDLSLKQNSVIHTVDVQKNIQRIIKENNLAEDDLKGIEIDLGF